MQDLEDTGALPEMARLSRHRGPGGAAAHYAATCLSEAAGSDRQAPVDGWTEESSTSHKTWLKKRTKMYKNCTWLHRHWSLRHRLRWGRRRVPQNWHHCLPLHQWTGIQSIKEDAARPRCSSAPTLRSSPGLMPDTSGGDVRRSSQYSSERISRLSEEPRKLAVCLQIYHIIKEATVECLL